MIRILLVSFSIKRLDNNADQPDFCSEKMLKGWEEDKSNTKTVEELLDAYIQCYNDSIAKHTEKMHIGLHICRGSVRSF